MADEEVNPEPLPTKIDTPFGTIDFDPTTADKLQNELISAKILCAMKNASLKFVFDGAWKAFVTNAEAGRIAPSEANAPVPPAAFVPVLVDGSYTIAQSGPPVCARPALPEDHLTPVQPVAGATDIGADLGGGWYAVGPHDGHKPGDIVVCPLGKLLYVGACVGKGWYQKIG